MYILKEFLHFFYISLIFPCKFEERLYPATQRAVERQHFKGVANTVETGAAGFSLGQLTYVTTLPVFAWRYIQTQI